MNNQRLAVEGDTGPNADRQGLTIVEVVIAVLIFGMCIAGLCGMAVNVKESSDLARSHYTAMNLAKNRLERIKTFDFDEIPSFSENNVVVDWNGSPSPNGEFQRTTTVSNVKTNLREVAVQVDIRNRVSLAFDRSSEWVRTYVADFQVVEE